MPVSNKRAFAATNSDEETPAPKKPRISSAKLLAAPKPAPPVDNDEKSDAEDGHSDSNEDASGDTEGEEEESGDDEGGDGQSNEEQGVEEDQGKTPIARPSSRRAPTALICHCGHPAAMKQSLRGLPHNFGEWFGTCASGSCQYWKWAKGSGQQRFNDAMDAQFNMHSESGAESEGGDNDPEDYSGIDPSDYDNHLDEPPEGEMKARIREMWRIERREQKGRNSEEEEDEEEDEADFQRWIEESGGPDVDSEDCYDLYD